MSTTAERGAEFLVHFGVKGMRWGVRNERRAEREVKTREKRPARDVVAFPTIGETRSTKARIATKGGEDHAPAADAIKVAVNRQKMKKSGVAALSNAELQEVVQRMNLELQIKTLDTRSAGKAEALGKKFLDRQLEEAVRDPIKTYKTGQAVVRAAPVVVEVGKQFLKNPRR